MDVAAALREAIVENLRAQRWRPGQRLPTERALGEQFGLGRSTVRRVLHGFKQQGLITQTVGSGTYVSAQVQDGLVQLAQMEQLELLASRPGGVELAAVSPAELMAARLALEPALVDLVVGHATAADFARMDHCMAQAEAAADGAAFAHWDAQLHAAIAAAAHNGVIAGVFRLVDEARAQQAWGALERLGAAHRLACQQQHRALLAALKDRDAGSARAACLAHLLHERASLLGF